jgi:hypothetical protein
MATKIKANRRLTEELLETANDMRGSGLLSKASLGKIIKRSFRSVSEPGIHNHHGGYGFRARAKRRVPE